MFNTIIISGRLTADPELRTTQSGLSVTGFTIANETGYGENKQTNFIDVVAWRKTAEFVTTYFHKGSMIGIEGQLKTRTYEDKNGNKRTVTEVVASNIQFMEKKGESKGDFVGDSFSVLPDDDSGLQF